MLNGIWYRLTWKEVEGKRAVLFCILVALLTQHSRAGHDTAFAFVSHNECGLGGLTISTLSAAKTCFS